jgi:hypothetical protein
MEALTAVTDLDDEIDFSAIRTLVDSLDDAALASLIASNQNAFQEACWGISTMAAADVFKSLLEITDAYYSPGSIAFVLNHDALNNESHHTFYSTGGLGEDFQGELLLTAGALLGVPTLASAAGVKRVFSS